jgi:hypothetical protein
MELAAALAITRCSAAALQPLLVRVTYLGEGQWLWSALLTGLALVLAGPFLVRLPPVPSAPCPQVGRHRHQPARACSCRQAFDTASHLRLPGIVHQQGASDLHKSRYNLRSSSGLLASSLDSTKKAPSSASRSTSPART